MQAAPQLSTLDTFPHPLPAPPYNSVHACREPMLPSSEPRRAPSLRSQAPRALKPLHENLRSHLTPAAPLSTKRTKRPSPLLPSPLIPFSSPLLRTTHTLLPPSQHLCNPPPPPPPPSFRNLFTFSRTPTSLSYTTASRPVIRLPTPNMCLSKTCSCVVSCFNPISVCFTSYCACFQSEPRCCRCRHEHPSTVRTMLAVAPGPLVAQRDAAPAPTLCFIATQLEPQSVESFQRNRCPSWSAAFFRTAGPSKPRIRFGAALACRATRRGPTCLPALKLDVPQYVNIVADAAYGDAASCLLLPAR